MSIFVKCNNIEDVNLCQMQQCRRCQSLSNATMSKMSIFVKCKVITKSPNHPFLPHFLIFFNKGQETHNPQSAASTPSYTATTKYRCIAAYRRRKHRLSPPQTPPPPPQHRLSPPQTPPPPLQHRRPRCNIAAPAATSPIAAANTAAPADVGSYLV